jgi:hypothetical protein
MACCGWQMASGRCWVAVGARWLWVWAAVGGTRLQVQSELASWLAAWRACVLRSLAGWLAG